MNSPTKNRMMLQSTFAIRVRAVVFAKNGRKNRTNDPPAKATRGSHAGVGDAKNAAATPTVTASVTTSPDRWSRTGSLGAVRVSGAARSLRNASQTRPIATARHATVTGRRYAVKVRKGIPDRMAMNAFCGLPTSVATLPTFAAIATATRYGRGFTRRARVLRTTTGVTRSAIVSFKTMADSAAVATMSHARSEAWVFARLAIREDTRSKNPQTSSPETRSIMPTRSTITSRLIARSAWAGVRTPRTSISAPPSIATAGRSMGNRRTVRNEMRTYVTRKTKVAAASA